VLQPSLSPPARLGAARPAGARPTGGRAGTRAAVLAVVLGLHGLVMALLLSAPALETPVIAPPMMVSLMAPPQPESVPQPRPPAPAPAPAKAVSKSTPVPRAPARPAQPQPATEASITTAVATSPAPPAPTAAPAAEAAPAPPAPPAPPTPARFDAAYLNNQTPYPPLAKRLRETGTVQLRVLVSAEGLAERIELIASSGSLRLDEGAQAAVRRWRFIPARQGDQNIASTVVVPIIFKLEES
jgi:protein TonB